MIILVVCAIRDRPHKPDLLYSLASLKPSSNGTDQPVRVFLRDIRLVDCTLEQRLLVKLLIEVFEVELETHRCSDGNKGANHHQDESQLITGVVGLPEEVGRNDIADLAKHVAKCYCDGAVLRRAAHGAGHPGADEGVRCVHTTHVDERCSVASSAIHGTQADDVANAAESNGSSKVVATLRGLVRVPGVHERADSSADVRRASEQESDDAAVPKAPDNIGEEIRESISGRDTDVEGDEEDHLPVESGHFQTGPHAGLGL